MQQCKICKHKFDSVKTYKTHFTQKHKISYEEYFVKYKLNGKRPTCKCGCGELTKFLSHTNNFRDYRIGHIARVKNNWGHNQKAIENSAQTRREQYANGERTIWNIGLTKETDERVKKYGELCSKSINSNKKELKRRSERMSIGRNNGTVITNSKENHWNWKGGKTEVQNIARADNRLYKKWKLPILQEAKFQCSECGSQKELHIHHDKETFADIIDIFLPKHNKELTFEEKKLITEQIVNYHVKMNISGKVLCSECHNSLHPSLNF